MLTLIAIAIAAAFGIGGYKVGQDNSGTCDSAEQQFVKDNEGLQYLNTDSAPSHNGYGVFYMTPDKAHFIAHLYMAIGHEDELKGVDSLKKLGECTSGLGVKLRHYQVTRSTH